MERCSLAWQYAAVGVAIAAGLELVGHAPRSRSHLLAALALAGGAAVLYANLIPTEEWSARSGVTFAQLPLLERFSSNVAGSGPLQTTAWGALTGWALRRLSAL